MISAFRIDVTDLLYRQRVTSQRFQHVLSWTFCSLQPEPMRRSSSLAWPLVSLNTTGDKGEGDRPGDVGQGELSLRHAHSECVQVASLRGALVNS